MNNKVIMGTCLKCGQPIAITNNFCVNCGARNEGWSTDYTNKCGHCHTDMAPGDRFCKYCGTKRGLGEFLPYQMNGPMVAPEPYVPVEASKPVEEPVMEIEPVVIPEPIIEQEPVVIPEPIIEQEPVVIPEPIIEQEPVVIPEPIMEIEPMLDSELSMELEVEDLLIEPIPLEEDIISVPIEVHKSLISESYYIKDDFSEQEMPQMPLIFGQYCRKCRNRRIIGAYDWPQEKCPKCHKPMIAYKAGQGFGKGRADYVQGFKTEDLEGRRKLMHMHFRTILRKHFSQYAIAESVPVQLFDSTADNDCVQMDFLILDGGKPVLALFFIDKGYRAKRVVKSLEVCDQCDLPWLRFIEDLPNEKNYVIQRIRKAILLK